MRTVIYQFLKDDDEVAELRLSLREEDSVEAWRWLGPELGEMPNNDQSLLADWHVAIDQAASRSGLSFTYHSEGDPVVVEDVVLFE